jgi:Fe-S cluster biogenesis protein NfuA
MPSKLIDDIKSAVANIASYINNDGGNIEFISFENKKLVLKISGACVGCEAFDSTFDGVKESLLIEFKNKIINIEFIY